MVFTVYTLVEAIFLILPAYAANGFVPILGGRRPIDFGRKFRGRPLFGPGKTWEGFASGVAIAVVISLVEMLALPYLPFSASPVPLTIVAMTPLLGFLLGLGAMLGDLAGSFIKRRLGIPRGGSAPLLDQEDFLVGGLLLASVAVIVKWEWVVLLLILTPIFHWIASYTGYLLRIKREPW